MNPNTIQTWSKHHLNIILTSSKTSSKHYPNIMHTSSKHHQTLAKHFQNITPILSKHHPNSNKISPKHHQHAWKLFGCPFWVVLKPSSIPAAARNTPNLYFGCRTERSWVHSYIFGMHFGNLRDSFSRCSLLLTPTFEPKIAKPGPQPPIQLM